jgi:cobalt transporter subunit CbtA
MFRRIVLSAVGAGIVAGALLTLIELYAAAPLIQRAELYEANGNTVRPAAHERSARATHDQARGRGYYSAVAAALTAIGYAFMLGGLFSRIKTVDWKIGLACGAAACGVFQLAPALGLPPALPGMAEADLTQRQLWWLCTVLASALGLASCYFGYRHKRAVWILLGVLLIAAPHWIGAPRPIAGENLVPAELAREFAFVALLAASLFWLVLGAVQGYLFGKLSRGGEHA